MQFAQKTPPSHRAPPVLPPPAGCTAFEGELKLILKEIKVISGKVKDEVSALTFCTQSPTTLGLTDQVPSPPILDRHRPDRRRVEVRGYGARQGLPHHAVHSHCGTLSRHFLVGTQRIRTVKSNV